MNLLDNELRSILREDFDPASCPPAELLVAALTGKIKRSLRDRLIDHLLGCEECLREVRLLSELDSRLAALPVRKAQAPEYARGFRLPGLRPVWAAILLPFLVAAAVWFFLIRPGHRFEDDVLRGEDAAAVEFLSPRDSLPPVPAAAEFRWSPVSGAERYGFVILDDTLETVLSLEPGSATGVLIPPDLRKRLLPGRPYYAKVTAFDSSGKSVAAGMRKFFAD